MLTSQRVAPGSVVIAPEAPQNGLPQHIPRRTDFVEYPSAWYFFCTARDLHHGPRSRHMLGAPLVAYRTATGRLLIMDGNCAHMHADLGKGRVIGEALQCPFHGWRYGPDGHCTFIPRTSNIPGRASLRTYPAVERHGLVFVFNGPEPLFPLPFFSDARVEDFVPASPVTFVTHCHWFLATAHAYDSQHFETAHARRLHAPLLVDCPTPLARRSRYTADVVGTTYSDRLLRQVAGSPVNVSITSWGGTLVFITAQFPRVTSRFMISVEPLEDGNTLCHVVAFMRQAHQPLARYLLQPVGLWLRRFLTKTYLMAEVEGLGNPQYTPENFVEADRDMVEYFCWAATLPQSAYTLPRR